MFSALGNIFSVRPRQTEQSDTRQEILRHDPEYEHRRGKKKEQTPTDFGAEGAVVSVDALRLFLEEFVRTNAENSRNTPESHTNGPEKTEPLDYKIQAEMELEHAAKPPPREQSGEAARAISTYEHTAQAQKSTVLLETTDEQAHGPALDLSAADIRTIHVLIEDLKSLQKSGVEALRIERAPTFLDSLVTAVSKAKTAV